MVDYHLEWGGMLLHDAVEVNCDNCETTDTKAQGVVYGLRGEC